MPKITQQNALIAALTAMGCEPVVPCPSHRYVVLLAPVTPAFGHPFLYIGRAGALRTGRTATTSIPMREAYRLKLLERGGYVS